MEITDKAAPVSTQAKAGTEPNVIGILIRRAGNLETEAGGWGGKSWTWWGSVVRPGQASVLN